MTLLQEVAGFRTLAEVVRWSFAQVPPRELVEVVAQDEFTNDVVIGGDPYLVFDTT
jgi:hypothetical protein